jgi:hypothetical protein
MEAGGAELGAQARAAGSPHRRGASTDGLFRDRTRNITAGIVREEKK